MTRFKLAWFLLGCGLLTTRVHAQTVTGLVYRVPSSCPTEADFVAQVAARGGEFRRDEERTFEVGVFMRGTSFAGSLRVRLGDQESDAREVSGATCAEVCEALAIVTAIALQPSAAKPTGPIPAPAPPPTPVVQPAPPESEPAPREGLRTSGTVDNAEMHVEAGTLRFTQALAPAVRGGVVFGLFSNPMPRYDLTMDMASFVEAPGVEAALVGPIVRLRLGLVGPLDFRDEDGNRASAYGLQGGIGICFNPVYDTRGWVFLVCSEFLAGSFFLATTDRISGANSKKNAVFAGVGIVSEVRYNLSSLLHLGISSGTETVSRVFGSSTLLVHVEFGAGLHFD
jgi:hypothetical protein